MQSAASSTLRGPSTAPTKVTRHVTLRGPVSAGAAAEVQRAAAALRSTVGEIRVTVTPLANRGFWGRQRWEQVLVEVTATPEQAQVVIDVFTRAAGKWNRDNGF